MEEALAAAAMWANNIAYLIKIPYPDLAARLPASSMVSVSGESQKRGTQCSTALHQ